MKLHFFISILCIASTSSLKPDVVETFDIHFWDFETQLLLGPTYDDALEYMFNYKGNAVVGRGTVTYDRHSKKATITYRFFPQRFGVDPTKEVAIGVEGFISESAQKAGIIPILHETYKSPDFKQFVTLFKPILDAKKATYNAPN